MKELMPTYANKMQPKQKIIHKGCAGEVKRLPPGLLWCVKCGQYVDAAECKYTAEVKG
jgi:hypothetical protein